MRKDTHFVGSEDNPMKSLHMKRNRSYPMEAPFYNRDRLLTHYFEDNEIFE